MQGINDLTFEFDVKRIEDVSIEYGRVMDWFEANWPESRIRLDVNSDQRVGVLTYRLSVLTGKEINDDQKYFDSVIRINRELWEHPTYMDKLKSNIYPQYTKSIKEAMNSHYQRGVN